MTTSPWLGFTYLEEGETVPETAVNEIADFLEAASGHFRLEDRDLSTPPGSPVAGATYLVAGTGLSGWAGHDGDIAYYQNTAWVFINVQEGFTFWVKDENKFLVATSASTFQEFETTTSSATEATASEIWTGTATTKYISPDKLFDAAASVALTDAATIAVDLNTGINFHVTLGGNRTLGNPTNTKAGQSGRIRVVQDGTGSRTLAYASNWKHVDSAPTIATAAGSVDLFAYFVHDSTNIELSYLGTLA